MGLFDMLTFAIAPEPGAPDGFQTKDFPRPACEVYHITADGHLQRDGRPCTFSGRIRIYEHNVTGVSQRGYVTRDGAPLEEWQFLLDIKDGRVVRVVGGRRPSDGTVPIDRKAFLA